MISSWLLGDLPLNLNKIPIQNNKQNKPYQITKKKLKTLNNPTKPD
jgi:hypothetical protein